MNSLKKVGTAIVGRLADKSSEEEKTRLRSAPATKYEQLDEGSGRQNFEIEPGTPSSSPAPPEDRGNLCYLAFFSLGTGVLFPWNAFITAVDYFQYLYPNEHVDRVFSVAYMLPNLMILGLLLVHDLNLTSSSRIYSGFVLYLFCLFSVPLVDLIFIGGDIGTQGTWNFTVAAVFLAGLADGVAQGSIFGTAAVLPPRCTQAVVSGTSVSGVVISLLRVLTKAVIPQDEDGLRLGSYLYFGVAGAFCLFCIFVQAFLGKLPLFAHYLRSDKGSGAHHHHHDTAGQSADKVSSIGSILRRTWPLGSGLFLSYAVTLSIFPGFLAEDVESETLGDWYAILLILGFNITDFVGKSLPIFERFRMRKDLGLFAFALTRSAFYPLYIMATSGPRVLRTEPLGPAYVTVLTLILGFSNGWLTANCLMEAPDKVRARDAEKTEMLMVWFLLLGLLIGALLGWLWLL